MDEYFGFNVMEFGVGIGGSIDSGIGFGCIGVYHPYEYGDGYGNGFGCHFSTRNMPSNGWGNGADFDFINGEGASNSALSFIIYR